MDCLYCSRELPDGAAFCAFCGKKQIKKAKSTKRANGEGSVRKLKNGKWIAEVVLWYYWDEEKNASFPERYRSPVLIKKPMPPHTFPLFVKKDIVSGANPQPWEKSELRPFKKYMIFGSQLIRPASQLLTATKPLTSTFLLCTPSVLTISMLTTYKSA